MTIPGVVPGYDPRLFPGGYGIVRDVSDRPDARPDRIGVAPAFETAGFPLQHSDIDGDQLQQDLVQALGRDVAIVARAATGDKPGVLRVLDPKTGLELRPDPAVVAGVLEAYAPPETEQARFVREFDAARSESAKLSAYRDHVAREAVEADRGRFLIQRGRERLAELAPKLSAPVASMAARSGLPKPPPPVTSRNPWNDQQ